MSDDKVLDRGRRWLTNNTKNRFEQSELYRWQKQEIQGLIRDSVNCIADLEAKLEAAEEEATLLNRAFCGAMDQVNDLNKADIAFTKEVERLTKENKELRAELYGETCPRCCGSGEEFKGETGNPCNQCNGLGVIDSAEGEDDEGLGK
jgi:hypothetical protein